MKNLISLIDMASKVCGSDALLAIRMETAQTVISDMRCGRRTVSPETAVELADIAGISPLSALAMAVLERCKGTRREETLTRILGVNLYLQHGPVECGSCTFRATPSPKGSPPEDCFLMTTDFQQWLSGSSLQGR